MIFPSFLNENDTIGITACSSGILRKIDKYEMSINHFKKNRFNILETNNVRTNGVVSSSNVVRASELHSLYKNNDVKLISIASGGDFLYDMLDLVDLNLIKNNIKWIAGSSDPTSLLFIITTNLDIATIYTPCNMSGFDMSNLHESLINYMNIIKGEKVKQLKYEMYELKDDKLVDGYNLTMKNEWLNINGNVDEKGILIGGCIECLKDVIGTKFDKTCEFVEKYKDEGIIWYFDVFNMTSEGLYNTLLQFRNAGWFKYTKAILIGKVRYPNTFTDMSYEELIKKAIDIPCVFNFDVGHVKPSFTMINGAKVRVVSNDEKGSLEFI